MTNLQTLKGEDMEIVIDVVRSPTRSTSYTFIELHGLASIWGEHGGLRPSANRRKRTS